jgi:hypothetical protein
MKKIFLSILFLMVIIVYVEDIKTFNVPLTDKQIEGLKSDQIKEWGIY